jgi:ATP-dependent DNA ligase
VTLPIPSPYAPAEALSVEKIPSGSSWAYEPKWDGFRCVVFRDGDEIALQSKALKPLGRYFPDVVAEVAKVRAPRFVLDGEIVVPAGAATSFDDLLQRIHPAKSRVEKLAKETPAVLIVFDLLAVGDEAFAGAPFAERRARLEAFAAASFPPESRVKLSPSTRDFAAAKDWLESRDSMLDGVMAKRVDLPYQTGERTGMQKIKRKRSADCVVGGFRYATGKPVIGSLLLGLYDEAGVLHHVGFTSSFTTTERAELVAKVEPLKKPPGFTGRAPGGPSRWSTERSEQWEPLAPELVVEVLYDHFSEGRFRHGTKFLRWRPDKAPHQCTMDQVIPKRVTGPSKLGLW